MTLIRALFAALPLLVAAPARADTTALYKSPKAGAEMQVEVAANGNVRASVGANGTYMLAVDGEDYIVFFTDKGPVVDRIGDVAAVMADYVKKRMPDFPWHDPADAASPFAYVRGGQMTVQGRPGTIWYMTIDKDRIDSGAQVVISSDPELAELGRAMVVQLERSLALTANILGPPPQAGMLDVLKAGAPLLFGGMELMRYTRAPIPPDRFALPAQPETREQVRVRFEANGGHIP